VRRQHEIELDDILTGLAAVLLLIADKQLELLAVVAPVSILVATIALRHSGNASVEYRRKR
jgi:hypothetical protein